MALLYLFDLWPSVHRLWGGNRVSGWQKACQCVERIHSGCLRMQHNSTHHSKQHVFHAKLKLFQWIFTSLDPLAAVGGTSTCTCDTHFNNQLKNHSQMQIHQCFLKPHISLFPVCSVREPPRYSMQHVLWYCAQEKKKNQENQQPLAPFCHLRLCGFSFHFLPLQRYASSRSRLWCFYRIDFWCLGFERRDSSGTLKYNQFESIMGQECIKWNSWSTAHAPKSGIYPKNPVKQKEEQVRQNRKQTGWPSVSRRCVVKWAQIENQETVCLLVSSVGSLLMTYVLCNVQKQVHTRWAKS